MTACIKHILCNFLKIVLFLNFWIEESMQFPYSPPKKSHLSLTSPYSGGDYSVRLGLFRGGVSPLPLPLILESTCLKAGTIKRAHYKILFIFTFRVIVFCLLYQKLRLYFRSCVDLSACCHPDLALCHPELVSGSFFRFRNKFGMTKCRHPRA